MILGTFEEEGWLLPPGQDGVGDRGSILVQAIKNWLWGSVEVLRERVHRGCQQPQGWSMGHVNILPLILSNILQKEPDKKMWSSYCHGVLLEIWKRCPADVNSLLRKTL